MRLRVQLSDWMKKPQIADIEVGAVLSEGQREEVHIESIEKNSLLFDFYGALLTERQREVMSLYHEENYSLAEIADEYGVSRQAVFSTLKKAEQILLNYEEKLGLVKRFQTQREKISKIDKMIDGLIEKYDDSELSIILDDIKSIIG